MDSEKTQIVTSDKPLELAVHPHSITLPVQWGDQDAFGHVNNVVYFRWLESGRIDYFRWSGLDDLMPHDEIGPILASIKCDYRRQLTYPDSLLITSSVSSIGRTSLKMVHLIYSTAQQTVAAEGDSVIVMFDYQSQRPIPVSDEIRAKIAAVEGRKDA